MLYNAVGVRQQRDLTLLSPWMFGAYLSAQSSFKYVATRNDQSFDSGNVKKQTSISNQQEFLNALKGFDSPVNIAKMLTCLTSESGAKPAAAPDVHNHEEQVLKKHNEL